ncbi:MAG: hypothetical protein KAW41_02210 [Candidatus Diapherotrites archaeon]|nr:hypothetical protein [Candidatus Diapherotrites archaeon]
MAKPLHENKKFQKTLKQNVKKHSLRAGIEKTFEEYPQMGTTDVRLTLKALQKDSSIYSAFNKLKSAGKIRSVGKGVYESTKRGKTGETLIQARRNFDGMALHLSPSRGELDKLVIFVHTKLSTTGTTTGDVVNYIFENMGHHVDKKYGEEDREYKRTKLRNAVSQRFVQLKRNKVTGSVRFPAIHYYPGVEIDTSGFEKPKKERKKHEKKDTRTYPIAGTRREWTIDEVVKVLGKKDKNARKLKIFLNLNPKFHMELLDNEKIRKALWGLNR